MKCFNLSSKLSHHGQIYASHKCRGPESMPTGSIVNRWWENRIGILANQGPGINSDRESTPHYVSVIALYRGSGMKHVDRLVINSRISSNRNKNRSSGKYRARESHKGFNWNRPSLEVCPPGRSGIRDMHSLLSCC